MVRSPVGPAMMPALVGLATLFLGLVGGDWWMIFLGLAVLVLGRCWSSGGEVEPASDQGIIETAAGCLHGAGGISYGPRWRRVWLGSGGSGTVGGSGCVGIKPLPGWYIELRFHGEGHRNCYGTGNFRRHSAPFCVSAFSRINSRSDLPGCVASSRRRFTGKSSLRHSSYEEER